MRTLHLTNELMKGADVKAAQSLLIKSGFLAEGQDDGVFGPTTAIACERAKYKFGYAKLDILPSYGDQLNSYLKGTSLPKAYQIRADSRKGTIFAQFEELALRQKIVTIAHWGVNNTHAIHYEQRRPIDGIKHPYQLPLYTDCSGFVTLCYDWAKAPDPNGRNYDGLGYTGTLMQHMKTISKAMVKLADLIIFGAFPGHHVAMFVGGPDKLIAHGDEEGPYLTTIAEESKGQPPGIMWLTLTSWPVYVIN